MVDTLEEGGDFCRGKRHVMCMCSSSKVFEDWK